MRKIGSVLLAFLLLIGILPHASLAAKSPSFDQDLEEYINEISVERGFEVTMEDIEIALAYYEESLDDYESVEDLSDFLGEVIKADLSNLNYIYEQYELDEDSLLTLLEENGDEFSDYIFLDNLDEAVFFYTDSDEEITEEIGDELIGGLMDSLKEEFDLTDAEIDNFIEHLTSIEDQLSQQETLDRLERLASRMADFENFTEADDLTTEQIAELIAVYNEFLSIFQMKTDFSLIKDGSEKPLSLADVMKLEELINANLKIILYNIEGKFLGDIIITGEKVDSDTIIDTGKKIKKVTNKVEQVKSVQKPGSHKTVKGGKLPETASNYGMNTLLGSLLILAGFAFYRKLKTK